MPTRTQHQSAHRYQVVPTDAAPFRVHQLVPTAIGTCLERGSCIATRACEIENAEHSPRDMTASSVGRLLDALALAARACREIGSLAEKQSAYLTYEISIEFQLTPIIETTNSVAWGAS